MPCSSCMNDTLSINRPLKPQCIQNHFKIRTTLKCTNCKLSLYTHCKEWSLVFCHGFPKDLAYFKLFAQLKMILMIPVPCIPLWKLVCSAAPLPPTQQSAWFPWKVGYRVHLQKPEQACCVSFSFTAVLQKPSESNTISRWTVSSFGLDSHS